MSKYFYRNCLEIGNKANSKYFSYLFYTAYAVIVLLWECVHQMFEQEKTRSIRETISSIAVTSLPFKYSQNIALFLFFFFQIGIANGTLDNRITTSDSINDDSTELIRLKKIIDSVQYANIDTVLIYIEQYAALDSITSYSFSKGIPNYMRSSYHYSKGNYEKAYLELTKGIEEAEKYDNDSGVALMFNKLGNLFVAKNEYYKAYDNHKQAFERSLKEGDTMYHSLFNLTIDLYEQKKYQASIDSLNLLCDILPDLEYLDEYNAHMLGDTYIMIFLCAQELKKSEEAEIAIQSAIKILSTKDYFKQSLADAYGLYAEFKYKNGQKNEARNLYQKSIQTINEAQDVYVTYYVNVYTYISKFYLEEGDYDLALKYAQLLLEKSEEASSLPGIITALDVKIKANDKKGNHEETYYLSHKFALMQDSFHFSSEHSRRQDLIYTNKIDHLENKNKVLKAEASMHEQNLQTNRYIIYAVLAIIGLVLSIVLFFFFNNMYKKQLNKYLDTKVEMHTSELEQVNFKLGNANRELESFVCMTSQDLKTPIRKIGDVIQHIQKEERENLPSQSGVYFKFIENGVKQMEQLIDDVLDFAMLSSGKLDIELVDLNNLIEEALEPIRTTLKERNAIVTYEKLPSIYTCTGQMRILLKNLVENGTKYNNSSQPIIKISYQTDTKNHFLMVEDNGIGIAEEDKDKVFGMFERLNKHGQTKGSGLGLAICKDMVEALGGSITIDSEVDKGSVFTISLPVEKLVASAEDILELTNV